MSLKEAAFYTVQKNATKVSDLQFLNTESRDFHYGLDPSKDGFEDLTLAHAIAEVTSDAQEIPLLIVARDLNGTPVGELKVGEEYNTKKVTEHNNNIEIEGDITNSQERRAFYLRQMEGKGPGIGSNREALEAEPQKPIPFKTEWVNTPYAIVGGWAASRYAPARMTVDVDVLITPPNRPKARENLTKNGEVLGELRLYTNIGLEGESWRMNDGTLLDVLTTEERWGYEAVKSANASEEKVVALPWLIMMKMDSARSRDQGDIAQMLGRATQEQLQQIQTVLQKHLPNALEELDSYIAIGRLELEKEYKNEGKER